MGKELHTTLEVQAAFQSLNNQLRLVRKTFNRIQRLDLMEDAMVNTKDKMAGRNRLRLGWGKE